MYQAGGATQGSILQEIAKLPQDQQKQIMAAFGKWAQSKGLNLQQLQGNEQALEQAMGQFLQEMQGAQKARLGAKLNYIRSLKGNAPEGMDVEYYKCGGQVKKKFIKKNACGSKGMAAVKAFKDKCGSKMKKKSCKEFGGEIQSDKCGSKMKKSKKEFGGEILFDKCGSKMKKKSCKEFGGNIESDKCGSKMKKKACGAKFELGGEVSKKPKKQEKVQLKRLDPKTTKTLPGGKYPSYWTSQERQTWERLHGPNDEGAAVAKEKCGGKAKKHQYGGSLNRTPFYLQKPTNKNLRFKYTQFIPTQQLPEITVNGTRSGGQLPEITVIGTNLSKSHSFPYGGINITSKSTNGGLNKKQRIFINPFDRSYLPYNKTQNISN